MPMKNPLLLAACLFALAPMACTAEEQTSNESAVAGEAAGSDAETSGASDTTAASDGTMAEDPDSVSGDVKERLRARLLEERPQLEITSIRDTPVEDLYEVVSGGQVFYITPDARYLLSGNLIDLREQRNLTDDRRAEIAHDVVGALDRDRMVVFEPANGPAENYLTVFTDTTCGYCRKLHTEVLEMVQDHPVEVRYAMFPRAGTQSGAADTLRDVWCAEDSTQAMTQAKEGRSVPSRDADCETPMQSHWEAAQAIGVSGTPYILVGDDGPIVPGYRPKAQLLSIMGVSGSE